MHPQSSFLVHQMILKMKGKQSFSKEMFDIGAIFLINYASFEISIEDLVESGMRVHMM